MDYSSLLNESQLKAVSTPSQYVRIIAGAGSGKTRVLTYRISYLIENFGIDPRRILAIAFTNKVAKEMSDRAKALVPYVGNLLHVSTFHAFCARFLREEAHLLGYPINYSIMDEDDQSGFIKDICVGRGYKKSDQIVKDSLRLIRRWKTEGKYPEQVSLRKNDGDQIKEIIEIYEEYEDKKSQMYSFDFDDLLLKTISILKDFPDVREKWQNRFDHILIDEFQDTNDVQYELVKLLLTPETSLYVVGDPDQTIYTWRGANQKIILDFNILFPDPETIILNRNYRSTSTILDAANKLIAHNKKRVPKDLFTLEGTGEPILINKAYSAEEEAEWVANKIKAIADKQGGDYSNIAVLYRSSYVTRPFESAFGSRRIPYRIFGGLRFYQRMEVKDVLAYFRLLVNEKDDIAFERIINVPKRSIGDQTLEKIKDEARVAGLSEYEYMKNIDAEESEVPSRAINAVNILIGKMEECKKKLSEGIEVYSATLRDFISSIGYFDYLKEVEDIEEDRIGNVEALFDDINHFISSNPESTFEEYLQNVSLLTSQDDMNDGNYLSLMTVHVAKGLEFDYVFIICLNDGTFPSQRAVDEIERDGEEEERRLAYVAFTRAKKRLYLSCNTSYSYIQDGTSIPSRYFKEADLKLPEKEGGYSFAKRGGYGGWKNVRPANKSFFSDGDAISPFEEKRPAPEKPKKESNGITDWKVGDRIHHETLGDGEVVSIISNSIIVIKFEDGTKKTMLSTHPMISRKSSKGGIA